MSSLTLRAGRNLAIVLPIVVADQASKWMAAIALAEGEVIELLPFANLRLGFNKGISFGLFPAGSATGVAVLIGLTALIVAGFAVWSVVTRNGREGKALSLILGGAIGNLIDRVRDGMVTDFIDLHAAGHHWPTFNLADIAITLGVAWLVLDAFRPASRSTQPADAR